LISHFSFLDSELPEEKKEEEPLKKTKKTAKKK